LLTSVAPLLAALAAVQVALSPSTIAPADMERFALRVANPSDAAVVAVRLEVPEALAVLGTDAPPGWSARLIAATDSAPQAIEWTGGQLGRGEFREFAFFARLGAAAKRETLVFPVRLRRTDGTVRDWRPGGAGQAPSVEIRGTVGITPGGSFVFAAASLGVAALAMALALRRPR